MMTLFHNLTFMIHGGHDHGGGVAAAVSGFLGFVEELLEKEPPEIFAAVFPGLASMQNIHPMLVHFPIAFLSTFLVLDLAGTWFRKPDWRAVASWLLYLGAIAAIFTATAGFIAADSVPHGSDVHGFMERHEHLGITVVVFAVALSAWRALKRGVIEGPANTLFLMLAAVMCGVMSFGADLGGLMVYRYGVAVSAVPVTEEALQHSHSGAEDAHGTAGHAAGQAHSDAVDPAGTLDHAGMHDHSDSEAGHRHTGE